MKRSLLKKYQGFSIIEFLVASVIGLLLTLALIQVYVAQTQIYKTTNSQDLLQNAQNAIINLLTPPIRSAGFFGCATINSVISNLNGGGANPIASLSTASPSMIMGYNGNGSIVVSSNPANSNNSGDWTPALDSSLVGKVQKFSDVIVILSGGLSSIPISVSSIPNNSSTFTLQSNATLVNNQLASVSDCVSTTVFQVTNISGNTISHKASSGTNGNTVDSFVTPYQAGAQFLPIQLNAFFIAQGTGGQSALYRGVYTDSWDFKPLIPGVEVMKVLYGIGDNGLITQYVSAANVTDWSKVYAVRIGFLIAGLQASGPSGITSFNVLNNTVTVPPDNRLRHVYEVNITLRNGGV